MPARKYTEEQRLAFMVLIDWGGSIRAAAIAVGAHPDAGYTWMKRAGLSTPRSTQRKYTDTQKADFLSRFGQVGNVSAVARELNGRPRKSLDWDTPAERIAALLDTT